jgi:hypothetical protein
MNFAEFKMVSERGSSKFLFNHENGQLKLLGENKDYAQPSGSGFICAHDVLEHSPADTGTLANEFAALGCGAWIRSGIYSRSIEAGDLNIQCWTAVGRDIGNTLASYYVRNAQLDDATKVEGEWTKEEIYMWDLISKAAYSEWLRACNVRTEGISKAVAWAQYGYRAAQKRYPNQKAAQNMYVELQDLFERICFRARAGWHVSVLVDEVNCTFDSQIIMHEPLGEGEGTFEVRNGECAGITLSRYSHWLTQEKERQLLKEQAARKAERERMMDLLSDPKLAKMDSNAIMNLRNVTFDVPIPDKDFWKKLLFMTETTPGSMAYHQVEERMRRTKDEMKYMVLDSSAEFDELVAKFKNATQEKIVWDETEIITADYAELEQRVLAHTYNPADPYNFGTKAQAKREHRNKGRKLFELMNNYGAGGFRSPVLAAITT